MAGFKLAVCLIALLVLHPPAGGQSPDQAKVDALGDRLPEKALLRTGTLRFRSPGTVMELLLADHERILISLGDYVTAWDAETGRKLWQHSETMTGNRLPTSYGVRGLALLPDGKRFLTTAPDGGLMVWDAKTCLFKPFSIKQPAALMGGGTGRCVSIDVSPDGKLFAVGNAMGMHVTDAEGKVLYKFGQPPAERFDGANRDRLRFGGPFSYGMFSPNGKMLARVDSRDPKKIQIYDAESGQEQTKIQCSDRVVRMDFSPDSRRIVATERDTAVRLYDLQTAERIWENVFEVDKTIENYTSAIKFSPNGKLLAVAERNQRLYLLEAATGKEIGQFKNHSSNPWAIAFTSDSKTIYSTGWGGTIHRWNAQTLEQIPVPGAVLGTSVVAASADNDSVAYADQSGIIRLVSKSSGEELCTFSIPDAGIEYLTFSPNRQHLAAGGRCDGKVHLSLWNYHTGKLIHRWDWEPGRDPRTGIEEIDFSSDGRLMAAAAFRQSAGHLFDITTGKRVARVRHPNIYGLDFSADDRTLITAGWDSMVRFWDVETGELTDEFEIPKGDDANADLRMYTVSTDFSGQLLATTHLRDIVKIWNDNDRRLRCQLKPRGSFVFGSTCFSPDGLWFAMGDYSGNVEIWDPWTGKKVHELAGHEDSVYTLDFGGDNRTLTSGGDSIGYCWDLRPEPADGSLDEQWDALCGSDSEQAYQAWWAMLDGEDQAVEIIRNKSAEIKKVVDSGRLASQSDPKERERRMRLLDLMVDKDADTIRLVAAKRIISVLSHIGSDAATKLLTDLSNHDDDFGKLAAMELRRRSSPASDAP